MPDIRPVTEDGVVLANLGPGTPVIHTTSHNTTRQDSKHIHGDGEPQKSATFINCNFRQMLQDIENSFTVGEPIKFTTLSVLLH